jgi:O-antigen ligase
LSALVHRLDLNPGSGLARRTSPVAIPAAILAASIGGLAAVSPKLALAGALGLLFVLVSLISLPAGVAMFTVLVFLEELPQLASFPVVKLAGAALAFAWLFHLIRFRRSAFLLTRHPLFGYGVLLFLTWVLASSLWAADEGTAIYTAFQVFQAVLLLMIVFTAVSTRRYFRWIVWAFIAGALLDLMAGFAGVKPDVDPVTGEASARLAGATGDPNHLAAVLVPALVLSLFAQAAIRAPLARLLLASSTVILAIGILLTESRGGIIAAAIALIAMVLLSGPVRARALSGGLIVAAGGVLYYALIASPAAVAHVTGFGSGSGRTNLWTVAMNAFQTHPIGGIGAGNFTVVEQAFAIRNVSLQRTSDVVLNHVVHNSYLHVLAELGLVGFVLFAFFLAGALVIAWRAVQFFANSDDRAMELLGRGIVIGSIGMFAAYFFLSAQYEKQLYLMLGALVALSTLPLVAPRPDDLAPAADGYPGPAPAQGLPADSR